MMGSERYDTFVRFVQALSAGLDDHEATAEEIAGRAYLSRHHFDRIVRSVGGEPPITFRRRVLLERAAYRLITTDRSILAVALEAGYNSHESFTRAFERAYGTPPSQWRSRPSKFQLEAPSGVHFHPPGGLRLPGEQHVEAADLIVRMVEHHIWLVGELVERAARLPDDALDRPLHQVIDGIDGSDLRWLLSRLIGQMDMWTAAMLDQEYDFSVESGETVTSMRRRLRRVGPAFLGHVRMVSEQGRFAEMFVDAMSEVPVVVTYGGMIAHVLTFSAHHRLLALTALREHGVDDLGFGDPKFWVAESAP